MSMIPLTGGFEHIPEGVHIFKIEKVEYKPDFGKMLITLKTKTGRTHIERFSLLDGNGKPNPSAMNAFSFFAKTVMDNFDLEEIDDQDLVGRYFQATVEHNVVESNRTPGKMMTFVQLTDKTPAKAFEGEEPVEEDPDGFVKVDNTDADDLLSSLLG